MNGLAPLLVLAAASVWVGQWISLHALGSTAGRPLPPRLSARLSWWAGHRAVVGATCAAVAVGGLAGGLLTS